MRDARPALAAEGAGDDPGGPPPDPVDLGHRLRAAREAQRSTLAQVAAAADLTKGFLSKVERGLATPSVASLLRLCTALDLSAGELFDDRDDHALVRADAYPPIEFGGVELRESLLTPARERRLQVIQSIIHPGGGSGDETYQLPVDVEFVLVLRGRLLLTIEGTVHELAAGDAMTYSPRSAHAFSNPDPREDACVLWVLAPALPGPVRTEATDRAD